jgi:hypothetical protein
MTTAATLHRSVRLSPLAERSNIPSLADRISMDVLQATRSDARNDVRKIRAMPLAGTLAHLPRPCPPGSHLKIDAPTMRHRNRC